MDLRRVLTIDEGSITTLESLSWLLFNWRYLNLTTLSSFWMRARMDSCWLELYFTPSTEASCSLSCLHFNDISFQDLLRLTGPYTSSPGSTDDGVFRILIQSSSLTKSTSHSLSPNLNTRTSRAITSFVDHGCYSESSSTPSEASAPLIMDFSFLSSLFVTLLINYLLS